MIFITNKFKVFQLTAGNRVQVPPILTDSSVSLVAVTGYFFTPKFLFYATRRTRGKFHWPKWVFTKR